MKALALGLAGRHTGLWYQDRWYRLAWLVWPQATAMLVAGWLMIGPSTPGTHSPTAPWAKPEKVTATGRQMDALRDKAKTDPKALQELQEMANSGDPTAEFEIATLYDPQFKLGKLTAPDINTAIAWYKRSAEHGSSVAQGNLGLRYFSGRWVANDYAKAMYWLRKAAAQNNRTAEHVLGLAYESGRGVPADKAVALQWFKRAADRGDQFSETKIGDAYHFGTGGYAQNDVEALNWYRRAAKQGNVYAEMRVGEAYLHGKGARKNLEQAFDLFHKAARAGNATAQFYLGAMYNEGLATPVDVELAFQWFKKGAENGNATAQNALGLAYANGRGVAKNYANRACLAREGARERQQRRRK